PTLLTSSSSLHAPLPFFVRGSQKFRSWSLAHIRSPSSSSTSRNSPPPSFGVRVSATDSSRMVHETLFLLSSPLMRPLPRYRSHRSEEHTSELQSRFDLVC